MKNIKVEDLSFAYADEPEKLVLDHISLDVKPGDFVCLLGQSGCGKSTFLRLIAGLEKPTSGSIEVDHAPVKEASLERSVVFQDYGLFPWMTAGENLILALRQKYPKEKKQELKKIAMKMLKEVGLQEDVYHKLPKELSGGMKQRCAIARSFSIDPPILLMDEPFGALDAVTRARLQDMVLELWAREEPKKTVFFVTHDVDEALLLANRICVFGQSPSKVIFECQIPEESRPNRETLYEDVEIMKLRNTLIKYINQDVTEHIV
jgi:NitT/TauT family transport system ATP-binding protein